MSKIERVFSLAALLIGVFYLYEAAKLPFFKETTFGAGFFPTLLGLALLAVSAISLVRLFAVGERARTSEENLFPTRAALLKSTCVVGSLVLYALVLEILGFIITTFLFLLFLFVVLEPDKRLSAIITATVAVALSFLFFVILLKVQLPAGPAI